MLHETFKIGAFKVTVEALIHKKSFANKVDHFDSVVKVRKRENHIEVKVMRISHVFLCVHKFAFEGAEKAETIELIVPNPIIPLFITFKKIIFLM